MCPLEIKPDLFILRHQRRGLCPVLSLVIYYYYRPYLVQFFIGTEPGRSSQILKSAKGNIYLILRNRYYPRWIILVTGLEPVRYCYQRILSPLCLPIPSHQPILQDALHHQIYSLSLLRIELLLASFIYLKCLTSSIEEWAGMTSNHRCF